MSLNTYLSADFSEELPAIHEHGYNDCWYQSPKALGDNDSYLSLHKDCDSKARLSEQPVTFSQSGCF